MLLRPRRCDSPHSPGFVHMSEASFDSSDRSLCSAFPRSPCVRRRFAYTRLLLKLLAVPVPFASVRLRNVAADAGLDEDQ